MEFDIQLKVNLPAMGFTTFDIKANEKGALKAV
jgi:mannosylglycerate hydrolase